MEEPREKETVRQHPYYVDDLSRGGSDVNSSNLFQNGEERKSLEKSLDTVLHSTTILRYGVRLANAMAIPFFYSSELYQMAVAV